jgi:hypothetical protein
MVLLNWPDKVGVAQQSDLTSHCTNGAHARRREAPLRAA